MVCYHTEVKKVRNGGLFVWVFVVVLGVTAGLIFGSTRLVGGDSSLGWDSASLRTGAESLDSQEPYVAAALRYARALQDGFCEEVIRSTGWMADRMHRVAIESSGQEAIDKEWDTLCDKVMARPVEGNLLVQEGIEDQYVFAPGATLEVTGVDSGRDDLNRPVALRVWIRVTYPRRQTAPLARGDGDSRMLAVRSMSVGVNLARDGQLIVKAGVIGNLDIDSDSLSFDWPSD
jgi:hypothetical protein